MQNSWNEFLGTAAGLDAVVNLQTEFESQQEPPQDVNAKQFDTLKEISLENIELSYGKANILKNVNLKIIPRTTIALVGESGAGKSSLANVIGGLIEPNHGELKINNVPLNRTQLNGYRNKIGYIAQDPVIFDDTIYNNVTFWAPKTEENLKKFHRAMHLVHLEKFLTLLPEQENSPLGNNGVLISGGQKQRISIARELFRDVDILIMDEATSALDSETEQIIKENIKNLHGEFTMIIIAHRLSTIKHADQIYVMSKGQIVNEGTYDKLIHESENFRRMVQLQEI